MLKNNDILKTPPVILIIDHHIAWNTYSALALLWIQSGYLCCIDLLLQTMLSDCQMCSFSLDIEDIPARIKTECCESGKPLLSTGIFCK